MHAVSRLALTSLCFASFSPTLATANGRFPATSTVAFHPRDLQRVFVGVTFGAILSADRGAHWSWVCEAALGTTGAVDPVFLYSRKGELFAATFADLMVSRDGGCTWTPDATFADRGAGDVVEHPTQDDVLYVPTSGTGQDFNALYKSTDAGRTWTVTSLRRTDTFLSSIRIAASNPRRFYVSGWRAASPKAAWIFRSDDGGETFTELDTGVTNPAYFYVLGVSPTNPDVMFTLLATVTGRGDVLQRSEDGGRTHAIVLEEPEGIKHMAISPDGQTVWVAGLNRVHRSTDGGRTFARLAKPTRNACVNHDGATLWACGWQFEDDFALATSTNGGDAFTRVFNLADLQGPLACPAGSGVKTLCEPLWPDLAALLGIQPRDAGAGIDAGAPLADGGTVVPPPKTCRCDSGSGAPSGLALVVLAVLVRRTQSRTRAPKRAGS